jgi:CheY-like chemotaxis protein
MVYGMVQRHSAEIEIESAAGSGTTVRLNFPAYTGIIETGQIENVPAMLSHLHILIVDDDPTVLKSLYDTLESDGHKVVGANSGQSGIETFLSANENKDPFDIVITDLGMPYIDGRRVAAAVKLASPTTPVIMLTGWGKRLTADGDIPPHVDRVLNKPPKLRELRQALAEYFNKEPDNKNSIDP